MTKPRLLVILLAIILIGAPTALAREEKEDGIIIYTDVAEATRNIVQDQCNGYVIQKGGALWFQSTKCFGLIRVTEGSGGRDLRERCSFGPQVEDSICGLEEKPPTTETANPFDCEYGLPELGTETRVTGGRSAIQSKTQACIKRKTGGPFYCPVQITVDSSECAATEQPAPPPAQQLQQTEVKTLHAPNPSVIYEEDKEATFTINIPPADFSTNFKWEVQTECGAGVGRPNRYEPIGGQVGDNTISFTIENGSPTLGPIPIPFSQDCEFAGGDNVGLKVYRDDKLYGITGYKVEKGNREERREKREVPSGEKLPPTTKEVEEEPKAPDEVVPSEQTVGEGTTAPPDKAVGAPRLVVALPSVLEMVIDRLGTPEVEEKPEKEYVAGEEINMTAFLYGKADEAEIYRLTGDALAAARCVPTDTDLVYKLDGNVIQPKRNGGPATEKACQPFLFNLPTEEGTHTLSVIFPNDENYLKANEDTVEFQIVDKDKKEGGLLEPVGEFIEDKFGVKPEKKTIVKVTINSQEVDLENLDNRITISLPGIEGQAQTFAILVEVYYSDGTTNHLVINFNYNPPHICPDWQFLRNECTGCNIARSVEEDSCTGQTRISAENVYDSGCSGPEWCEQPTPTLESTEPPAPSCITSCGINNGQNCTNQYKADVECADYYRDDSACSFSDPGPRGDGCIP